SIACPILEHDPEKWIPVFGKDHAPKIAHVTRRWPPADPAAPFRPGQRLANPARVEEPRARAPVCGPFPLASSRSSSSQRIDLESLKRPSSLLNHISRQIAPPSESKNSRPMRFSANLRLTASVGIVIVSLVGGGLQLVRTPNVMPAASVMKPAS